MQLRLACLNIADNLKTFSSTNGESNIDVTLATASVDRYIANWRVHEGWTTSDHRAITFELLKDAEMSGNEFVSSRFNLNKIKWEQFDDWVKRKLNRQGRAEIDTLSAEDQAQKIQEILLVACERAAPKKRWMARSVPWWNAELTTLRKETKQDCARNLQFV